MSSEKKADATRASAFEPKGSEKHSTFPAEPPPAAGPPPPSEPSGPMTTGFDAPTLPEAPAAPRPSGPAPVLRRVIVRHSQFPVGEFILEAKDHEDAVQKVRSLAPTVKPEDIASKEFELVRA